MQKSPDYERIRDILQGEWKDVSEEEAWIQHYLDLGEQSLKSDQEWASEPGKRKAA